MDFFEIFYSGWLSSVYTSAGMSLLIILTQKWHGKLSNDTADGPQKFHVNLTPRIGGIALYFALIIAWKLAPISISDLLGQLLIAGFPAFVMGVAEDISKSISPLQRLLGAMFTGVAAWWLTGYSLNHVEIFGVDRILAWLPASVLFTAFAVAGVTNAINIIDGFNGLAGGTVMICLLALGVIAMQVGDTLIAQTCLTMIVIMQGFMLFNYPYGKIFLGDGGAYLLGFILAWLAVMLPMRNPQLSVWAPLLVCSYPINESIFSMGRRLSKRSKLQAADSAHMHSLIKIKIIRRYLMHLQPHFRNSLVAPFCWTYALLFAIIAVILKDNSEMLKVAWVGSFALYTLIYSFLHRMKESSKC